jgi:hypothetical protein
METEIDLCPFFFEREIDRISQDVLFLKEISHKIKRFLRERGEEVYIN